MTKLATTHTHMLSFNTLTESNSHLLYALICPCHTYKELVQQIHELPLTSRWVTPLCCVCLLVQASCRCTHSLWSWSFSFKCLWHLSGTYHGRERRRGGDHVHHRRMWVLLLQVSLAAPLLASTSSFVLCFAEKTMCSGCLYRENKMVLPQR